MRINRVKEDSKQYSHIIIIIIIIIMINIFIITVETISSLIILFSLVCPILLLYRCHIMVQCVHYCS